MQSGSAVAGDDRRAGEQRPQVGRAARPGPAAGAAPAGRRRTPRSVPSSASTLIAAVMSAVRSSSPMSWQASSSMPSIPSVPLISARPSFSAAPTGSMPAAASASAAGTRRPSASRPSPSPISASAQCGQRGQVAGAAQRAVLGHDRRDAGVEQRRVAPRPCRGGRRCAPWPASTGRSSIMRADDLALHLGARPGGVRPDEAALQLGAQLRRDVPVGQRAEPGRDAVVRHGVVGQRLDDGPARRDRAYASGASSTPAPCRATATTSARDAARPRRPTRPRFRP